MNRVRCILAVAVISTLILITGVTRAADNTLAASLNMYVFPAAGQSSAQQSSDEMECYNWAVKKSGTDPFTLQKEATQQAQQAAAAQQSASSAGSGAGAKGAMRGAVTGALIGEIVDDDAGKGAAIGGTIGFMRGRHRARMEKSQAQQRAQQQSQQQQHATTQRMNDFKRAFSVCLEAKNYMVK